MKHVLAPRNEYLSQYRHELAAVLDDTHLTPAAATRITRYLQRCILGILHDSRTDYEIER